MCRRVLATLLLLIPAAVFVLYALNPTTGIDTAVRGIGFYPINPPSTLRHPGAIYHISPDGRSYSLLCGIDNETLIRTQRQSDTARRIATELTKLKIRVDAEIVENKAAAGASDIAKSIAYSLDAVRVYEISLEDLGEIAQNLQNTKPFCRAAVERYLNAGAYVCQIQQVMKASASYQIDDQTNGSGKFGAEDMLSFVRGKFEGDAKLVNNAAVVGTDLFYGMRTAPQCLSLPDRHPPLAPDSWLNRFRNRPLGFGYF